MTDIIKELLHFLGREYLHLGRFLLWQFTPDGRILTYKFFRDRLIKGGSAMGMDASND